MFKGYQHYEFYAYIAWVILYNDIFVCSSYHIYMFPYVECTNKTFKRVFILLQIQTNCDQLILRNY